MAAKDEDGNVNADDNLAESVDMEEMFEDISNVIIHSQANPDEDEMISPSGKPRMADALNRRYDLIIKESATKAPVKNDRPLPDDEDVTNSIDYTSSEYDVQRDRLKRRFSRLLPIENVDDSKELSKTDPSSSSSSDHLEAERVQYGTQEPVNQPMPTRQSITTTTASSPGSSSSSSSSQSVSMTEALLTSTDFVPKRNQQAPQTPRNPQATNPHYPQLQVPSGQYGNITRPHYLPPPPSALPSQQHGGGSDMVHYGTMVTSTYWRPQQNNMPQLDAFVVPYGTIVTTTYWRTEQNDMIYNMPQLDPSMVPYVFSVVPYPYGSPNHFGTWSDNNNPANARFGYEAGASSNQFPSMQHYQGGGEYLNAWRANEQNRQYWDDICASVNPRNDRRDDPSDQTQQPPPPRGN